MFSQTVYYAFCAAVKLAESSGEPVSAGDLARRSGVPFTYLAKLLQRLSKAGVVISRRGPNGGYLLKEAPDAITLLDIYRVIKTSEVLIYGPRDARDELSGLDARLNAMNFGTIAELHRTTLGELCKRRASDEPFEHLQQSL